MNRLGKIYHKLLSRIRNSITDDVVRRNILFVLANAIMGLVSAFMTIVNIFTEKHLLMASTLLFAIACFLNLLLFLKSNSTFFHVAIKYLFIVEILVLCLFFCISGTPEGFSALWFCFIPSFSFTLFGRKRGSILSFVGLLSIIFLFWFPAGRSLLFYRYTDSFMLRFPMIYTAFLAMGFFVETIRAETQSQVEQAEKRYQYLYKHDSLTGLFNRYGFNEQLDIVFADSSESRLSLLIIDIDYFKKVNDTYGHRTGDIILKSFANILKEQFDKCGEVSRWGGEEFTVFLNGYFDAPAIAEQLRKKTEEASIPADGKIIKITISIGVCVTNAKENITIAKLVTTADKCLYEAKTSGRNKVICTEI